MAAHFRDLPDNLYTPLPRTSAMASESQGTKGRDRLLSALEIVIQGLNLAKDTCGFPPAQAAFGSVSALLTMIRVRFPTLCDEPLIYARLGHHDQ